jgi:GTP-binding protein
MRRKNKILDDLEKSSVSKAIKSIKESDITWLIIDATQGPGHQDKTIASFIMDEGKACILVVNKWDLVEKDNKTYDLYREALMAELPFLDYVPVLFVSAVAKQRIYKLLELSQHVYRGYSMRLPTHLLNESLDQITLRRQHPMVSGKRVHLKYMTQVGTCPPTFLIFTNRPDLIDPAYERYLTHGLRERFGFYGSPIRIEYRSG